MNIRKLNESFKRLYEDAQPMPTAQDDLRTALESAVNRIMDSGDMNLKSYEIAIQDVIESFYPDMPWWEVTSVNIFWNLFENRDPMQTIEDVVNDIENQEHPDENVEEDLDTLEKERSTDSDVTEKDLEENLEEDDYFDFSHDIYQAISKVVKKYKGKDISNKDIDHAIENFINRYQEDSELIRDLEECLKRINEAQISDEDQRDSDLIRSMLTKMQQRSNARFTPEENAVLDKYGITRNNDFRNLSVDGRELDRDVDTRRRNYHYMPSSNYSNGTPSKINYADRARKLRQRKDSQIFTGPGTIDNDQINVHGSKMGRLDSLNDAQNYAMDLPMIKKVDDMKSAIRDRKYYQGRVDSAAAKRKAALDKARAEYDARVSAADRDYEYDSVSSRGYAQAAQDRIDKMLKRK